MEKIDPHLLWIGHARDGQEFRAIFAHGIQAVVQLAVEEPTIVMPRELIYFRIPLFDGAGNSPANLGIAISTLERLLYCSVSTLVCCGAGMSRSPVIAAAAITRVDNVSFEIALQRVTASRPADVAPALAGDVVTVLEKMQERS